MYPFYLYWVSLIYFSAQPYTSYSGRSSKWACWFFFFYHMITDGNLSFSWIKLSCFSNETQIRWPDETSLRPSSDKAVYGMKFYCPISIKQRTPSLEHLEVTHRILWWLWGRSSDGEYKFHIKMRLKWRSLSTQ